MPAVFAQHLECSRNTRRNQRRCAAFTLIELLVVISIITLLAALLLPTLQRVRNQARAVVCQSNLRQCGVLFENYTSDHDGYFFRPWGPPPGLSDEWGRWPDALYPYYKDAVGIFRCPRTTANSWSLYDGWVFGPATRVKDANGQWVPASYGLNYWVYDGLSYCPEGRQHPDWPLFWRNVRTATGLNQVPVFLDALYEASLPWPADPPPEVEFRDMGLIGGWMSVFCINRHHGCINGLFMDWSVRRIGLKELWTLKWHRQFVLDGPWTRAGGVQPEDWPPWLRRFKEY